MNEQGLQVFLDVDNLANSGAFDDQLWNHLQACALQASSFVPLLSLMISVTPRLARMW
jgi:hypothetical protein